MDNVTHALAGALLAAATLRLVERRTGEPPASFRRAAFTIGVLTAELPDADLVYSGASLGMGKLGYLLHHRGHTHTVLFAVGGAIVVWAIALAMSRQLRSPEFARALLGLAVVGTGSHLVLDYTNSYGVHPFWPFDTGWFYGDAVFIVEPWLWIVALPPLIFVARSVAWRVLAALLLTGILVAAWRMAMVGTGVAAVLTGGAILWLAVMRSVAPRSRVALAVVGWLSLEGMFFTAAGASRRLVAREVGDALRDVVLSPSPGNPLCLSALVVTEQQGIYRVSSATVAPAWRLHPAAACRSNARGLSGAVASDLPRSPAIEWGGSWSAPVSELRQIATGNCEVAAALRFIRVPIWRQGPNGDVTVSDLRFGEGEGSFASIEARSSASCPHPVPNWEWPRHDLLGAAP
ncbi:MAG: metal-dependent hydrolase [Gemmatimonadaceae bacterium]|nr:metal-dependent hydrolase [Gemmatimonadaceae bacterium]